MLKNPNKTKNQPTKKPKPKENQKGELLSTEKSRLFKHEKM